MPAAGGGVAGPGGVPHDDVVAWAASGAMALTGWPDRPLGPPAGLVPGLAAAAAVLADRSAALGRRVAVDPLALLAERAAIAGLTRRGTTSCGGATRLVRARDGWLAASLARDDDVELVPAWLRLPGPPADPWSALAAAARAAPAAELADRGARLGLPVAALPPAPVPAPVAPPPLAPLPLRATRLDAAPVAPGGHRPPRLDRLVVADLGSLWAGPLCGSLLAAAGATVAKVESVHRPDGARRGPAAFFDLLNAGKRSVALDLRTAEGRRLLARLLRRADVVIEASRPRALAQLGVRVDELLRDGGPRVWVSVTGHGRTGPGRHRVAFGDDAAVAGGLVARDGPDPAFCADAVPDPASGLVAAAAVLDALAVGGRWLLDVAMAGVAAHLAGPTLPADGVAPAPPRARPAPGRAPELGADTERVLAELGVV